MSFIMFHFTWVIELILLAKESLLESTGLATTRGCADDIGTLLFDRRKCTPILWEIFDIAERG